MDEALSREDIHEMAGRWMARPPKPDELRIVTDTSDFFQQNRRPRPQLRRMGGVMTVGGIG
jgi:hypothetical protein